MTTKLESHIKNYTDAKNAFYASLKALDLDYIDLYIIHAPWPWSEMGKDCKEGNVSAYKALEEVYQKGLAKGIGVSNFDVENLDYLINHSNITPHVNQIAYFIGLDQEETISYSNNHQILIEAYSPLGIGFLLENPVIKEVALKYQKSSAQLCIRYLLQKNTLPLPKTVNKDRMYENADLEFDISSKDMDILDQVKGDPRRWE